MNIVTENAEIPFALRMAMLTLLHRPELAGRGRSGWYKFRRPYSVQDLSQTRTVLFPVLSATEFIIPKEPKWTDFFTAIQTGQWVLNEKLNQL